LRRSGMSLRPPPAKVKLHLFKTHIFYLHR